jgi:zona occludens toxin
MAINLITGLPGSSKTLYALYTIENRRIADNKALYQKWVEEGSDEENPPHQRTVYYFNIPLYRHKLPHWVKMEKPEEWLDKPNGNIFVFDECQEAFEPMNNSEKRPRYYTELSKHRHRGHDMYFMTQHPTYVDTYVRKNTEEHTHIMRTWGAATAMLHVWKGVRDNCDKSRKDSQQTRFKYPKHVYEWYRSSFLHTYKLKIPKQVFYIGISIALIIGAVYGVYRYFNQKIEKAGAVPTLTNGKLPNGQTVNGAPTTTPTFQSSDFVARIPDVPWSAPRYDELTKATVAPRILGCMILKDECKCMTQQGTYHYTTMQFCKVVIENGIFQDFDDNSNGKREANDRQDKHERKPDFQPVSMPANNDRMASNSATNHDGNTNPQDFRPKPWTSRFTDTATLSTLQSK